MATLKEVHRNLQILSKKDEFYAEVLRVASRFGAYLIDLNQIQLSQGKNIFGDTIGVYSKATEERAKLEYTRQPKIAGEDFNFEWTGELFDGMYIKLTREYLEIYSSAPHTELVVATYSSLFGESAIFGLTEESLAEFVEEKLKPEMQKWVRGVLNLPN